MEESSEKLPIQPSESNFRFIENHFVSLPSQGNVFTLVPLVDSLNNCKILVGTLLGKIFCIEYQNGSYSCIEDPLQSFPSETEIISMNAFNEGKQKFTVALTVMTKGTPHEYFILFYCGHNFDRIGHEYDIINPTSARLSCVPYGIFFFPVYSQGCKEVVCLLCGGDNSIHLFRQSEMGDFIEGSSTDTFPEFHHLDNITLYLDIWYSHDHHSRVTATSGEDGKVNLFYVSVDDCGKTEIKGSHVIKFDFPASSLRVFSVSSESRYNVNEENPLVVISTAVESCFIYSCCNKTGNFERHFKLPESENFDVVNCCLVCDVDFDGENEIILGTYGQMILIYKQVSVDGCMKWILHQTLSVPSPVLAMAFVDLLCDGVKELIVQTMTALHVFQNDPFQVSCLIKQRLESLISKTQQLQRNNEKKIPSS